MRNIVRWSVSTATTLLFALPALAQIQYRLEVYGGATIPMSDKDFTITVPQSSVPINGTHEFSWGGRGGIRIGVDGRGHWGQDIDYSYGSYASRILNHSNSTSFSFTPRVHQISWNALWYPGGTQSEGKVLPYFTVGVGGVLNTLSQRTVNEALDPSRPPVLNPNVGASTVVLFATNLEPSRTFNVPGSGTGIGQLHNDNIFAFNAGFGARFRVNKRYSFRIDIRDHMSRATRYQIPRSASLNDPKYILPVLDPVTEKAIGLEYVAPGVQVFPVGGLFHQVTASIAVVFHF